MKANALEKSEMGAVEDGDCCTSVYCWPDESDSLDDSAFLDFVEKKIDENGPVMELPVLLRLAGMADMPLDKIPDPPHGEFQGEKVPVEALKDALAEARLAVKNGWTMGMKACDQRNAGMPRH